MLQIKLDRTSYRLLPVALMALWNGCTVNPDRLRGEDYGIDESYACPEGFVGFNFSDSPIDTRSEYYQGRLGDAAAAPLPSVGTIEIQDVTCTSTDTYAANRAHSHVYHGCQGKTKCQLSQPPNGCGERVVTYSCGVASADADSGVQPERSARGTQVIDCTGASKKLAIPTVERTLCVPRLCPINTHRDQNLNCVPDESMPGLKSAYIHRESFSARYAAERLLGAKQNATNLYRRVPFDIDLSISYTTLPKATAPERVSVTYWLADVFVPKGSTAAWNSDDAVLAFRCTAFDVEATIVQGRLSAKQTQIFPPTCFDADGRVQDELKRRTGLKDPEKSYQRLETRLFHSFDPHGRVSLEDVSDRWNSATFAEAVASPCAPNPLDFFYDAETKTFDMVGYYRQRSIDEFSTMYRDQNASRAVVLNDSAPQLAHLVAEGIRLGKTSLVVGQGPVATDPLPVDVSWSMPNYDARNPLVPDNVCSAKQNGWKYTITTDDLLATGGAPKFCNYAPPNLRADVYLSVGKAGDAPPLLGSIPLSGGLPQGSTANGDLRFSRETRAKFFDASSPMYISPEQKSRAFKVFYCFVADRPDATFDVRSWTTRQNCNHGNYDTDCDIDTLVSAKSGGKDWHLEVSSALSLPSGVTGMGPGCVMSDTPLMSTADRLIRPIEPVFGVTFAGDTDNTGSGDGGMSATQTNSSEVTCSGAGEQNCVEVVSGGMKSQGELGRSYFAVQGSLNRKHGSSVRSDFTGEMLGMQVFDMADSGSGMGASWPGTAANQKLTLTVVPPWDALYKKFKLATGGTPVEWSKGRYAGVTGLGVGLGYKVPFHVGPIPGLITITASVGVAVEAQVELAFAPDEGGYPCVGSERCYELSTESASQGDASSACTDRGGRLAELSSAAEASQLEAALTGKTDSYWIGGQMAYEYSNPFCLVAYNEAQCKSTATSSYRWLSNDAEFAKATGSAAATYQDGHFHGSRQPTLYTKLPITAGLTYAKGGTTSLVNQTEEKPYVCVFEPASSVSYLKWSLAINLGVGAGVGLSVCSPNDDYGFCLGGNLNVLSTGIKPTWKNEYYWLSRNGAVKRRTGKTSFSIPWNVTILEGALWAQANAYYVSATWNIVEFEGFKLAEGNLLSFEYPFQVDYE